MNATDKQISFIEKLATERGLIISTAGMSKQAASKQIDQLLKTPKPKAAAAPAKTITVTRTGMYEDKGTFYMVKKSKTSGRLYAMRVDVIDGEETKLDFVYAAGAIYTLTNEMKLTAAVAKEFGMLFGVCVCCGKKLTDKSHCSQVAGYGKTCAAKNGWWYPTAKEAAQLIDAGW